MVTWTALVAALLSLAPVSAAELLATPNFSVPFDVSKPDAVVEQEFRIDTYRSYVISIQCSFHGQEDRSRVQALIGDGSRRHPGVPVPIRVRITKLEANDLAGPKGFDSTINTTKPYGYSDTDVRLKTGYAERLIVAINLPPSKYRIVASTLHSTTAFDGTPCRLAVAIRANVPILPYAVNLDNK
jgi:hypothetical protein